MKFTTNKMVKLAFLASLSIILMLLIRFPLLVSFLEYDPADIPILIGTFMYGPISGVILTVVVSAIQAFTVSASSGWIGFLMHVIATGTFVMVAGLIYKKVHSFKGALLALISGSLAMTLIMIPLNLVFTTLFMGVPIKQVISMLVPVIIPFNLIKAGINSAVTFVVYKKIANFLRNESEKENAKNLVNAN